MKTNCFLVTLAFILSASGGYSQGSPSIISTAKNLSIETDDIAHFTCKARDSSPLTISWEKAGKKLSDDSLGIATLVWINDTITESHLFVAVSGADKRGKYICIVSQGSKETKQEFVIKEEADEDKGSPSKGLTSTDLAAIGISLGLTVTMVLAILFFLIRGIRHLERERRGRALSTHMEGADNRAVDEDETPDTLL